MAFVYMVRCRDDSIYTGIAKDINKRLLEHKEKLKAGAKYTKSHEIIKLEALWETKEYSDAAKLEYRIKRLTRQNKLLLIQKPTKYKEFFEDIAHIKFCAKRNLDKYEI